MYVFHYDLSMSPRLFCSFILAFFFTFIAVGEASGGHHGGSHGRPPAPLSDRGSNYWGDSGGRFRDDEDDDDDDGESSGVSSAVVVGGFVLGGILVAALAIVVTLYCLKKAKHPKTMVGHAPARSNVAVIGSLPTSAKPPPYSSYGKQESTRNQQKSYNLPAVEEGRLPPYKLELSPVPPSSPPPPYTKY